MRIALLVIIVALSVSGYSQQPSTSSPPNLCLLPEQKQLDFWLGEWDLTWPAAKEGEIDHGTNSVHRILDGCVVEENFSAETSGHLRGRSVSIFDARSNKWKQTWVDNEGSYLDFSGEWKDGQMVLSRETSRNGKAILQRMVFKHVMPNEFDWSWESSGDGGKTWRVNWPIHYKRKSS
jgi:hypothetical protein